MWMANSSLVNGFVVLARTFDKDAISLYKIRPGSHGYFAVHRGRSYNIHSWWVHFPILFMYVGVFTGVFKPEKIKCKASQSLSKLFAWLVYIYIYRTHFQILHASFANKRILSAWGLRGMFSPESFVLYEI